MISFSRKTLIVSLIALFFSACADNNKTVYEGLSYVQTKALAEEQNLPFCIIVADGGCGSCTTLKDELNTKYKKLNYKAVFNAIDTRTEEHQWFRDWLYTPSSPIICIFSANGDLINIVAGANTKSMQSIEKAIDGISRQVPLYYSSPLIELVGSKDVVAALDMVLKCKLAIDHEEDATQMIESTLSIVRYPFSLYLKCLNEERNGNTEAIMVIAQQILEFRDDHYVNLFFQELLSKTQGILKKHGLELCDHEHSIDCDCHHSH